MWVIDALTDKIAWELSRRELRRLMTRGDSVAAVVKATGDYHGYGLYRHINALHEPSETTRLAALVQQLQPKRILEIGTCWGGSLFVWCRTNPQAELIVSMDLPGGQFGGGYHAAREKLYREFAFDRRNLQLELLRVDSHLHASFEKVRGLLGGHQIDFLFIDGDHTFEGVRQDFAMYSPLLAPGGLIALHDINTKASDHHVRDFWQQLRANPARSLRYEEIVANPSRGEYGLGLIWVEEASARKRVDHPVCESHG